jgi:hypothetical protein
VVCSAAAVLSVAYAVTHVGLGVGSLSVPARAAAIERPLVTGTYSPEEGQDGEFRWTRGVANFYWPIVDRYILLKLAVPQPDVAQRPVQLTVSSPCGPLIDVPVTSPEPVTLGIEMPQGQKMVHLTVAVSRTFRPSDFGGEDTRRLGAIAGWEFSDSAEKAREQQHTATVSGNWCVDKPK